MAVANVWCIWVCKFDGDPFDHSDWMRIYEAHVPEADAAFNLADGQLNRLPSVDTARRYDSTAPDSIPPPYPPVHTATRSISVDEVAILRRLAHEEAVDEAIRNTSADIVRRLIDMDVRAVAALNPT